MNLLDLEYFLIIAEELNFTKASKRLFISQQALSQRIQKLETHFGVKLFDRISPITLTAAGRSLQKYAQQLIKLQHESERELQDIKNFRYGEIFIGVTHVRGSVLLPPILSKFCRQFPQIKIHLTEGTSQEIENALLAGEIDLCIGFPPSETKNTASEILMTDRFKLVVPEQIIDIHLPEKKSEICKKGYIPDISLFKSCPFIKMHPSTWNGAIFTNYCKRNSFNPIIFLETRNLGTLISLCLAGLGIIMCSEIFLHSRGVHLMLPNASKLITLPIKEEFSVHYTCISYLKNKYQIQAVQEFIRIAKEVFHN